MTTYVNLDTIQRPSGGAQILAQWGDQVNDNFTYLFNDPVLSVYYSGSGGALSAVWTIMPFNTVTKDNFSGYSLTTFKYTVPQAGEYSVAAALTLNTTTAGHAIEAGIYKNGAQTRLGPPNTVGSAALYPTGGAAGIIPCVAGDTLAVYYYATNTDAFQGLSYYCYMDIAKVGN